MIEAERRPGAGDPQVAGSVASEVVADVLAMLDVEESMLDMRGARSADETRGVTAAAAPEHRRHPASDLEHVTRGSPRRPDGAVCQACLDEGLRVGVAAPAAWSAAWSRCCDSSPSQHATAHFQDEAHPVIQSAEPGEDWRWCFVHHTDRMT